MRYRLATTLALTTALCTVTPVRATDPADQPYLGQGLTAVLASATPVTTVGDPSSAGQACQAIARWDVVPSQPSTADLPGGVVAFHTAGIDRVEFSVDGGPVATVRNMTLNPVSGA